MNITKKNRKTRFSNYFSNLLYAFIKTTVLQDKKSISSYYLTKTSDSTRAKETLQAIKEIFRIIYYNKSKTSNIINISEYMIVERLFGLNTIGFLAKSQLDKPAQTQLIELLRMLSYLGFGPLQKYILNKLSSTDLKYFEEECNAYFVIILSLNCAIQKVIITAINAILLKLEIQGEALLDELLSDISTHLHPLNEILANNSSYVTVSQFELLFDLFIDKSIILFDYERWFEKYNRYSLSLKRISAEDLVDFMEIKKRQGISFELKVYVENSNDESIVTYKLVENFNEKSYINNLACIEPGDEENTPNTEPIKIQWIVLDEYE